MLLRSLGMSLLTYPLAHMRFADPLLSTAGSNPAECCSPCSICEHQPLDLPDCAVDAYRLPSQETQQLQGEVTRLSRKLAAVEGGATLKDGEIMREILMTSERTANEKNKVQTDSCPHLLLAAAQYDHLRVSLPQQCGQAGLSCSKAVRWQRQGRNIRRPQENCHASGLHAAKVCQAHAARTHTHELVPRTGRLQRLGAHQPHAQQDLTLTAYLDVCR